MMFDANPVVQELRLKAAVDVRTKPLLADFEKQLGNRLMAV